MTDPMDVAEETALVEQMTQAAAPLTPADTLTSRTTAGFIVQALIFNLSQIEAAQLALERSRSDLVTGAAAMLIEAHERSLSRLRQTAAAVAPGIGLPAVLDPRRRARIDDLSGAAQREFDRCYLKQQIAEHQETIALHEAYAEHGDEPLINNLAEKRLPTLRRHLHYLQIISLQHED